HVWCTLVIAQGNVERTKEFAESFRMVGTGYYLGRYAKDQTDADLYRAVEIGGLETKEVQEAVSQRFLGAGCIVGAFGALTPQGRLPGQYDLLAGFLLKSKCPAWDQAIEQFEAATPKLDKALTGFLTALDSRYADPDALNYVGACFKNQGY